MQLALDLPRDHPRAVTVTFSAEVAPKAGPTAKDWLETAIRRGWGM